MLSLVWCVMAKDVLVLMFVVLMFVLQGRR